MKLARRAENAFLHEETPLGTAFSEQQVWNLPAVVQQPAMLIFLAIGHYEHLHQDTTPCANHLKLLVYNICQLLHPRGTVVMSVPAPLWKHHTRLAEYLQQPGLGLVVEDQGLLVEYGSRTGGLTASAKKFYVGGTVDTYLLAHHASFSTEDVSNFCCHLDVTPQTFADRATATDAVRAIYDRGRRTASPVMSDVPHKGPKWSFHDNVARFAIQRFTNQGDTVMTLSAESDGVAKCALHYGRRFEGFMAVEDARKDVTARLDLAWEAAWRQGKFSRSGSAHSVVYIGPGSLPDGIPANTTPSRVQLRVKEKMAARPETGTTPSEDSVREVAKEMAASFGWALKENDDEGEVFCLYAVYGKKYNINHSDIQIWGDTVIYDTRQAALDSLDPSADLVDLQFVRLVLVADTSLLKRMCVNGKEVVRSPEAALYLKVAPTCPAYYAMWAEDSEGFPHHEVISNLQRTSDRRVLVEAYSGSSGGAVAPVRLGVSKQIDKLTPGDVVKVKPGVSVVREGWCN